MSGHESKRAEDYIRGRLYSGEIEFKEADIAEALGISRTPVREASERFSSMGILDRRGGRASRIRTSIEEARSLLFVRDALESRAVEVTNSSDISLSSSITTNLMIATEATVRGDVKNQLLSLSNAHVQFVQDSIGPVAASTLRSILDSVYMFSSRKEYFAADLIEQSRLHNEFFVNLHTNPDLSVSFLKEISEFESRRLK